MRRLHMTFEESGEFAMRCYNAEDAELLSLMYEHERTSNEIDAEKFKIVRNEITARGRN